MNSHKGFTLVELMITVVIIGILSAIAVPSYLDYIQKSRRSDAIIALTKAEFLQQKWYNINGSYTNQIANIGGATSPESYYALSVTFSGGGFTITATGADTQADDTACATLNINFKGVKGSSGGGTNCWD